MVKCRQDGKEDFHEPCWPEAVGHGCERQVVMLNAFERHELHRQTSITDALMQQKARRLQYSLASREQLLVFGPHAQENGDRTYMSEAELTASTGVPPRQGLRANDGADAFSGDAITRPYFFTRAEVPPVHLLLRRAGRKRPSCLPLA